MYPELTALHCPKNGKAITSRECLDCPDEVRKRFLNEYPPGLRCSRWWMLYGIEWNRDGMPTPEI